MIDNDVFNKNIKIIETIIEYIQNSLRIAMAEKQVKKMARNGFVGTATEKRKFLEIMGRRN